MTLLASSMAFVGFLAAILFPFLFDTVSLAFNNKRTFFTNLSFTGFVIKHGAGLITALCAALVIGGAAGFRYSVSIQRVFQIEILQQIRRRRFEKISAGASVLLEKADDLERRNKRFKLD